MALLRWLLVAAYAVLATLPLAWMAVTAFKSREDSISPHARFVPALEAGTDPLRKTFERALRISVRRTGPTVEHPGTVRADREALLDRRIDRRRVLDHREVHVPVAAATGEQHEQRRASELHAIESYSPVLRR